MENKEQKKMPEKSIKITIGKNEYAINFPKNGELIDIERRKIAYTNGTHKDMLQGISQSTQQAYLLVEAIATFSVLIPALEKDLNVPSLLELDPYQSKHITSEYYQKYYPWFNEWMEFVNEKVD